MQIINIHDAKTLFSRLIEAIIQGEQVIIVHAGMPVALLTSICTKKSVRRPGALKRKIYIADDFNLPLGDDLVTTMD